MVSDGSHSEFFVGTDICHIISIKWDNFNNGNHGIPCTNNIIVSVILIFFRKLCIRNPWFPLLISSYLINTMVKVLIPVKCLGRNDSNMSYLMGLTVTSFINMDMTQLLGDSKEIPLDFSLGIDIFQIIYIK